MIGALQGDQMTKRKAGANALAALIFGLICCCAALADETIQIGQSAAVLLP
jgi:hypothetical protein